ncbi:phosphate ABC transporter permease PstA [Aquibium sp. A9E412]|uniref:phosphate ABC transporter permease PstA n=1 Tax=Aquibium sp. A9E412 TaxID=2976767 RepID=UPI0025AFE1CF|nr:phosphate ABC transporter permease PstA [Aquibium sp. A9E412]MDN2565364.1 phosphate ABC transporter permease PstA [Aquibium sp. A9E412]
MSDLTSTAGETDGRTGLHTSEAAKQRLGRRYRAEARFKWLGAGAVALAALFLLILLSTIVAQALPAFRMNYVTLPVDLSAERVDPADPGAANYDGIVNDAILAQFPAVTGRQERRLARGLISSGAPPLLRDRVVDGDVPLGGTVEVALPLDDFADLYLKGLLAEEGRVQRLAGTVRATVEEGAATLAFTDAAILDRAREAGATAGEDGALALTASTASLLVRLDSGVFKLTGVAPADDGARAEAAVLRPLADAATAADGEAGLRVIATPEGQRKITDQEVVWIDGLAERGLTQTTWNTIFLSSGASREAEMAGIWGAVVGSALTMLVTLALSFPIGVAAAIYLEEFAPKNRLTGIIEVNINNLAAVPSIVFGLLGLAVFLNWFNLPRSAPLVGGMVLALMTLPTMIIAARAALRAVPPSIREAALGVGASKVQTVFHHVLPLAMPGILTGTIIGMAQALGETAPLLMIGMVAFIVDVPGGFTDPATVLPVQIFMWADFPEPAFQQKTSAAILILLAFLVLMNAIAVVLRKRFERRW